VFDHVGADPTYWDDALTERVHVGDGPGQPVRQPLADAVWDAVDDDIARLRQLLGDPLPEWPRPSAAPGMAPGRLGTEQGTPTKEERLMPGKKELPSTLERSAKKAQRTWIEAHDSAVEEYGEGERAHRTAFSALKHSYEKVGDHWEAKDEKGPSDKQAAKSGGAARKGGRTAGGVDANASKSHLMEVAKKLDVTGRSRMTKDELVDAIKKANARQTRKSRS
jgi:cation transport regulator ChaB